MRLRNFVIVLVVITAVLLVGGIYASATGAPPARETPAASVFVDEGEAFLLKKGNAEWVSVGAPTEVAIGDRVRTGRDSSASLVFFDQSAARLDADTEIEIEALEIDPDNFTSQRVDLAVVAGRIWSRVIKFLDADSAYTAETSTLVATVRGTAFAVDAREADYPRVWVAENRVGVALVRPPDVPGGRRTLGPLVEVGEGEEADREVGRTFAVTADRVRVQKFSADADRQAYAAGQLLKDQKFLESVREASLRRLGRYAPGALPGSAAYPLKRLGERLRLALTTDPEARRDLGLAYADRRFAEAVILARSGRGGQAAEILRSYYRQLAGELRLIDPRTSTLEKEQALRRFKKISGRLKEREDLVRRLELGEEAGRLIAEAVRDPLLSPLEIPDLISRLEESYRQPVKTTDEPLYVPQTIEAAPATSTPVTAEPAPGVPPPANTNQPAAATPVSLSVLGARSIMTYPDTQQFRARVVYSDDSTKDVTELAGWSLEGGAVGTVSYGFLTTSDAGTASVVAVYQGLRGSFSLLVQPPAVSTLDRVSVSCPSATLRIGLGEQCSAAAVYSDGTTRDITEEAAWSVSDPTIGRVTAAGYFTASTIPGTTNVTAAYSDGVTRSGAFTITTTIK